MYCSIAVESGYFFIMGCADSSSVLFKRMRWFNLEKMKTLLREGDEDLRKITAISLSFIPHHYDGEGYSYWL